MVTKLRSNRRLYQDHDGDHVPTELESVWVLGGCFEEGGEEQRPAVELLFCVNGGVRRRMKSLNSWSSGGAGKLLPTF